MRCENPRIAPSNLNTAASSGNRKQVGFGRSGSVSSLWYSRPLNSVAAPQQTFGIGDTVLCWFQSYMSSRRQFVRRGPNKSSVTYLVCGVHYCIRFISYSDRNLRIVATHVYRRQAGVWLLSADCAVTALTPTIADCVKSATAWMRSTDITARRCRRCWSTAVPSSGPKLPSARDLRVYVDSALSMRTHVQRRPTVLRCFAALRQLRQVRRSVRRPLFRCW